MGRECLSYCSVRFNVSKPQHSKIVKFLNDLDLDACKSKNQFILDAIEFYIDHYGDSTFSEYNALSEDCYVTKGDLEKQLKFVKQEASMAAKNEVIRQLGGIIMNGVSKVGSDNCKSESFWETNDTDGALIDIALDCDNE